jgi:hypothetical protein
MLWQLQQLGAHRMRMRGARVVVRKRVYFFAVYICIRVAAEAVQAFLSFFHFVRRSRLSFYKRLLSTKQKM